MNLIKKGILFYISIIGLSIIIQSCCEMSIKIIGNGNMFISQIDSFQQDTIKSEFKIVLNLDLQYADNLNNLGIISTSYATQCAENLLNTIRRESVELTCDKEFNYEGKTIEAKTNFLDANNILLFIYDDEGTIEIHLKQDFLNDAEFSSGIHEFEINVETSDDKIFTNKASTYLKL